MSFRIQPTPPARPNRCQLFGPGSNTKLPPKMAASAADVINLDLEDAVAPDDKPQEGGGYEEEGGGGEGGGGRVREEDGIDDVQRSGGSAPSLDN